MKSFSARLSRIYSAISFAVAAAAVSTAAIAAQAEVSGVGYQPEIKTPSATREAKTYMAFNQGALIPTFTITAVMPGNAALQNAAPSYDAGYLDELDKRVSAELSTLIELRSDL